MVSVTLFIFVLSLILFLREKLFAWEGPMHHACESRDQRASIRQVPVHCSKGQLLDLTLLQVMGGSLARQPEAEVQRV